MNSVVNISQSQVPSINIIWQKNWINSHAKNFTKNTQSTQINRKN